LVAAGGARAIAAGPADAALTPAQQGKVAALRTAMLRRAGALRGQLEVKLAELHQLWLATQPDRAAILKKHGEANAIHAKLVEAAVDFDLGMLKVLTPAQRAALAPGMSAGLGPGPGPRGHGPGFGPPPPGFGPPPGPPPPPPCPPPPPPPRPFGHPW
jgi:Spy/CpxP family protein refolding chaperone